MNSLVAICDILGFTNLVNKNTEDLGFISDCLGLIRRFAELALSEKTEIGEAASLEDLQSNPHVGVACFSDTFFFYTKTDTNLACVKLLGTVAALIFLGLRNPGTRIRAGVAYGEVEIDSANSVYVGLPLIEAHNLERAQDWSGGALAPSAIERVKFSSGVYSEEPMIDWNVIRYPVPLKEECKIESDVAVDWTIAHHRAEILKWAHDRDEPSQEEWEKMPRACKIWKNARIFHDSIGWCCGNR